MTSLIREVERAIGLRMQLHDFGHEDEGGNFRATAGQIGLFETQCSLAARAAVKATIKHLMGNVTEEMCRANPGTATTSEVRFYTAKFGAMLSVALSALEEGEK